VNLVFLVLEIIAVLENVPIPAILVTAAVNNALDQQTKAVCAVQVAWNAVHAFAPLDAVLTAVTIHTIPALA